MPTNINLTLTDEQVASLKNQLNLVPQPTPVPTPAPQPTPVPCSLVQPDPPLSFYSQGVQYEELIFNPGGTQYRIYPKNYNSNKLLAVKFVPPADKKNLEIVWIYTLNPSSMIQSVSEVVGDFSSNAVVTSGTKRIIQGAHINLSTVPGTGMPTVTPGKTYYLNLRYPYPEESRDIALMLSTFSS